MPAIGWGHGVYEPWEVGPMCAKSDLGCYLLAAPFMIAILLLGMTVAYGIVVIVFRYAFGVELWNPFH